MERIRAKALVNKYLSTEFPYIYKSVRANNSQHMIFTMESNAHHLQMSIEYKATYLDILCFISPAVFQTIEDRKWQATLEVINHCNWYVKDHCGGRFYLDDDGNIAYSIRLGYKLLSKATDECFTAIETAVEYFEDLFVIILDVAQGRKEAEEAKKFIDLMWG